MILKSVSSLIISLALSSCMGMGGRGHEFEEEYKDPEPQNNVITKREWDLCCRICMKGKKLKGLVYIPERDVLQCRCKDGVRAEIYPPEEKEDRD